MARILSGAGFRQVYCTPHCIKGVWENSPGTVRQAVENLQKLLDDASVPLLLQPGMEYYLDEFFPEFLTDPQTLGDSDYILVESPSRGIPDLIKENIFAAIRAGLKPVLAHPERNPLFAPQASRPTALDRMKRLFVSPPAPENHYPSKTLLAALRDMGCYFQGNLGSLAGRYGKEVQGIAQQMLSLGVYTHFGSDAHRAVGLEAMLKKGLTVCKGETEMGIPPFSKAG